MLTLKQASEAIANRQTFNAGNLTAYWITDDDSQPNRYVVNSYGVAIAISQTGRDSYIFDSAYNYSQTTSKHANITKKAWGLN